MRAIEILPAAAVALVFCWIAWGSHRYQQDRKRRAPRRDLTDSAGLDDEIPGEGMP